MSLCWGEGNYLLMQNAGFFLGWVWFSKTWNMQTVLVKLRLTLDVVWYPGP